MINNEQLISQEYDEEFNKQKGSWEITPLLIIAFLGILLLVSVVSAATSGSCSIVGQWKRTSHGETFTYYDDGTATNLFPNGDLKKAVWVGNGNTYTVTWEHGYFAGKNYVDSITIAPDCNSFSGKNNYNDVVNAFRVDPTQSPTPAATQTSSPVITTSPPFLTSVIPSIPPQSPTTEGSFSFNILSPVGIILVLCIGGVGYSILRSRKPSEDPHKMEQKSIPGIIPANPPVQRSYPESKSQHEKDLIFISAKSEDFAETQKLYNFLKARGLNVFFSQQTLPEMGSSDYRKEIDRALDVSKHMIVVTSKREYVESPWVEAEWGLFVNEKRSGRKKGNIITLIIGAMRIEDLPGSLRYYEVIPFDLKTFEKILQYLK